MGKPFEGELDRLEKTIDFTKSVDVIQLSDTIEKTAVKPLYIIGSGGSFSACTFAEILHQQRGMLGKAITPLESYYYRESYQNANVLIISASGKNKDILFAFDIAIKNEPDLIINICTTAESPLAKKSNKFSLSTTYEFPLPSGKDGFLASNSLVAFFILLARAYKHDIKYNLDEKNKVMFRNNLDVFFKKIGDSKSLTFNVLYGGWSKPVAIDIESKFTEAALANTLLADYRNFGHGRHHWFDKRQDNSVLIALITPEEEKLALKTLSILPKSIPVLILKTQLKGASATIDLLIKSFYLVNRVGQLQMIDPGRPGVPSFGSKLYHLSYSSLFKENEKFYSHPYLGIQRKIKPELLSKLSSKELKGWEKRYKVFTDNLSNSHFGSVILDYDRTICSDENRLIGPSKKMSDELERLLAGGILVGIVTGRGGSVKADLRNCIDKKYWKNILVGYYNGDQIGDLSDDNLPNSKEGEEKSFIEIQNLLKDTHIVNEIKVTQRQSQLTIECKISSKWEFVKPIIYQKAMAIKTADFLILESSRSLDIIKRPKVSKLNIIDFIQKKAKAIGLNEQCLCIGDKGKWPGNDFELLNTPYSLSVDQVSFDPNSCWNLAPVGIRNTDACLLYLAAIRLHKKYFKVDLP